MKFIKYIMLMLIVAPVCAQQAPLESESAPKPSAGFWGSLRAWWTAESPEARMRRLTILDFTYKLRWSRNLVDIDKQIQDCKRDKKCSYILSSREVQNAIDARRQQYIGWLNKSINDVLESHGKFMFYDFNKGINTADEDGNTALHNAMFAGIPSFVAKWLIENGADVNAYNKRRATPLILAVLGLRSDLVSLLLQKGANYNLEDKEGDRAIDIARAMLDNPKIDKISVNAVISILQAAGPSTFEAIEYGEVKKDKKDKRGR